MVTAEKAQSRRFKYKVTRTEDTTECYTDGSARGCTLFLSVTSGGLASAQGSPTSFRPGTMALIELYAKHPLSTTWSSRCMHLRTSAVRDKKSYTSLGSSHTMTLLCSPVLRSPGWLPHRPGVIVTRAMGMELEYRKGRSLAVIAGLRSVSPCAQ
ncbi:uncharacterized protein LOC119180428 isoform X3 [Rhipicephalus microplus]